MKFVFGFFLLFTLVSCASNDMKDKSPAERKADLYYGHGTQALLDQDYTSALTHLQKAVEFTPEDSKVHNNLGMAYYFKGDVNQAVKHLNQAISLDEKNTDARVNLAGIYFAQNRLDLSYAEYLKVSKDLIYPHQFRTYYNMALILEKQNRTTEAREMINRSLKENSSYCPAFFLEGVMNQKVQNFKGALTSFQNASKGACYEEPAPHYSQAEMLIKLGRIEEAREKINLVMEKFSRTPYFAKANRLLVELRASKPLNSEEELIRKARIQMDEMREKQNESTPTYQGTSF